MAVAISLICFSCGNGSNADNGDNNTINDIEKESIKHDFVDLGLPSGTLWATCNVGADTPEDYGDYFAWGETKPKKSYYLCNYRWCNCNGIGNEKYTKYYSKSGNNGFQDNLSTLEAIDDAATSNWGAEWRTPTKEEWEELIENCVCTRISGGYKIIGSNDNSIFIPAAGFFCGKDAKKVSFAGENGEYWSSSLYINGPSDAWFMCWDSHFDIGIGGSGRSYGRSVRPVRVEKKGNINSIQIDTKNRENPMSCLGNNGNYEYVDLGLPSGTKWATCNVGANSPEEYGDFFAWGETKPKDTYLDYNYTYHGNTTVLPKNSDVASVRWGNGWRIPTKNEFEELRCKCTWTMTIMKGKKGYKVTGSNGCYIFIPAAGYYTWRDVGFPLSDGSTYDGYDGEGSIGRYWSSSIDENDTEQASYLLFNFDYDPKFLSIDNIGRYYGHSIRPVCKGLNGSSEDGYGSNQQYEKDDLSWIQGNWRYVTQIYGVTVDTRVGIHENMIVVMHDGEFDYRGSYTIDGNQLIYYYGDGTAGYIVIDRVNRRLMFDDTHAFQRF